VYILHDQCRENLKAHVCVKVVSLPNDMYILGVNTYVWNLTASEWTTWHFRCLNLWEVELHSRVVKIILFILGYPLQIWYRRLVVLTRFLVALLIPPTELLGNLKARQDHLLSNSLFRHNSIFRLWAFLPLECIGNKLKIPNKSHVKNRRYPLLWRFERTYAFFLLVSSYNQPGHFSEFILFCYSRAYSHFLISIEFLYQIFMNIASNYLRYWGDKHLTEQRNALVIHDESFSHFTLP